MKIYKTKKIALFVLIGVVIAGTGCKKTFDINHDPNNPPLSDATPKLVFRYQLWV